jgi:glycerophosphoryl diester phosphodiesterase
MNFKTTCTFLIIVTGLFTSYYSFSQISSSTKMEIDYQAHRGGRGLMPENTIPAMLSVMDNQLVTTLEMDLAITKDKQVVVSHDPILNPMITTKPDGGFIKANEFNDNIIYQMNYDQLQKFDVGLKPHPAFSTQKKLAVFIPTLNDLIDSVETKGDRIGRKMLYNIEIKSVEGKDGIEHPAPEEFVDLVVNLIKQKRVVERTSIQSFDLRPLKVLHQKYPLVQTAYLVEGPSTAYVKLKLEQLGFTPTIYSPEFKYVTKEVVEYCHEQHMKIIPWTVNTKPEIDALMAMGVDGLITDYPNLIGN